MGQNDLMLSSKYGEGTVGEKDGQKSAVQVHVWNQTLPGEEDYGL